jgi:predicted enzyme related to lactoylglutathione lyase
VSRVVHFEVPVDDPARARAFYEQVAGWSFQSWGDQQYWLATTGPDDADGINGALTPRTAEYQNVVLTLDVDSLDAALTRVEAVGGRILQPRNPVPGIGWFALCVDTEGNTFGLLQSDAEAR